MFKVGDVVKCVCSAGEDMIKQFEAYVVENVDPYTNELLLISERGVNVGYHEPARFEKVVRPKSHDKGIKELLKDSQIEKDRLTMYNSLLQAIQDAGGSIDCFKHRVLDMTVEELINQLGQNGVRFTYKQGG